LALFLPSLHSPKAAVAVSAAAAAAVAARHPFFFFFFNVLRSLFSYSSLDLTQLPACVILYWTLLAIENANEAGNFPRGDQA
jgi:hypothetical protein